MFLLIAAALLLSPASAPQTKPPGSQTKKTQPAAKAQPSPQDPVATAAARTAEATMNWNKASTPGMHVNVQLLKRGEVNGRLTMDFRVKVTNAPKDARYKLTIWPVTVGLPYTAMDGLAIRNDGVVYCPEDSQGSCAQKIKGNELHLTYQPTLGEIFRQALVSDDGKSKIFFSFVPTPIIEKQNNCSLEAVRLSPSFELALIRGKGFTPGEDVSFHTQSYQEAHNVTVKADSDGAFEVSITPAVKGRTSGTIEVVARGKSCAPTMAFNWGL